VSGRTVTGGGSAVKVAVHVFHGTGHRWRGERFVPVQKSIPGCEISTVQSPGGYMAGKTKQVEFQEEKRLMG